MIDQGDVQRRRWGRNRASWLLLLAIAILIAVELVRITQSNRLAARIDARDQVLADRISASLERSPVLVEHLAGKVASAMVEHLGRDENFQQRLALKLAEGLASRLRSAGATGQDGAGTLAEQMGRAARNLAATLEPKRSIGKYGGTLRIPIKRDPDSFNYISARSLISFAIGMHLYEGLFFRNVWTERDDPVLAESWEVSADRKDYTIHLRRDVHWSDGEPFDADDVIFTFEAIADPSVVSYSKQIFEYEMPGGGIQRVRMERINDHTVRFHQPLPYAAFLKKLYHPILPEHRLRAALERGEFSSTWSIGTDPQEIVGTGPFMLEEFRPGEEVVLRRNPHYWRRDAAGNPYPYLDQVRFRVFEDEDAAQIAFRDGRLDILPPEYISGERFAEIRREAGSRGFDLIDMGQSVGYTYLVFNENTRINPRTGKTYLPRHLLGWFRERRFRQAVAHAIDRAAVVSTCYDGLAAPVYSVYNRACGKFHNDRVTRYPFDLERARDLLEGLDLKDRDGDGVREDAAGHKVIFTITWYRRSEALECLVRLLRKRLADIGILARGNQVGDREYSEKLFSTYEWEVLVGQESGGAGFPMGPDPCWSSRAEYHMWLPKQETPATAWEREIDALFQRASTEPDESRRLELLYRFQDIVAREAPIIPIAIDLSHAAVRPGVENFLPRVIEPNCVYNLFEIWKRDT